MRILVVGSGGREHAIVYSLAAADRSLEIYVAPGNAGTSLQAHNVDIPADDVPALLSFARERAIDLTIAGPEQPLVLGIADAFRTEGLAIVGPSASAARMEGSKVFAKDFMSRHGIPTAAYRSFSEGEYDAALSFIREIGAPVVVKASGLAAGKGAVVCATTAEAESAARQMLLGDRFGDAGREIVVEEFMSGEEASVFAVCDGRDYVLLAPAQDHKRVGIGDTGPNTGGMGAYAPAPIVTSDLMRRVEAEIVRPTIDGLAAEGMPYNGFLYVGLMIEEDAPRVVEYNCRLGDPEAQVILPMLGSSFVDLMRSTAAGELAGLGEVALRPGAAVCVVLCSGGYPGSYEKGFPVRGLEEASCLDDVLIFHAGTASGEDGTVTSGGRVLGVTGLGDSLEVAIARAYGAVGTIYFQDLYFRTDIGKKGLKYLETTLKKGPRHLESA